MRVAAILFIGACIVASCGGGASGPGGTSSIAQSGTVHVVPGRPRQVSVMSVTPQAGGKCEVNLVLRDGREVVGRYSMDCGGK